MHVPINVKFPYNISTRQIEFNSAFKGLINNWYISSQTVYNRISRILWDRDPVNSFWHVYVLVGAYFVWPWAPYHTIRDVTSGPLSATDTYIVYHVTHFEASRNVILHTRYVSTYVGAGCGRGRRKKTKAIRCGACYYSIIFTRIGCTLLTCDMYMSDLRHIYDPVLSSLKMEGIRLLFYFIRRGPGPNEFTLKCLSNFFKFIH
jgi:hypothetical protein